MRTPLVMSLATDAHKWGMPEPFDRMNAFSIKELCEWAGIPCRAFGHRSEFPMIGLIAGEDHFLQVADDGPYYSIGRDYIFETAKEDIALRVLEVMAYTFKEYSSRECLNGQGLFVPPTNAYKAPAPDLRSAIYNS